MGKALIGVTVAHYTEELSTFPREYYVQSIRVAGGSALLIPPVADAEEAAAVMAKLDGLVLSGGGDISPLYIAEFPLPGLKGCFPQRDLSEILLAKQALSQDVPLLGICRGIQVLAVAAGGSIYQDIPSQHEDALLHNQTAPREFPWHAVDLRGNLQALLGRTNITVNSFHHQAVREVPSGFRIGAQAADGIIEGIEAIDQRFCIGVQWHPEAMPQDPHSQALFTAFIQAAKSEVGRQKSEV